MECELYYEAYKTLLSGISQTRSLKLREREVKRLHRRLALVFDGNICTCRACRLKAKEPAKRQGKLLQVEIDKYIQIMMDLFDIGLN